MASRKAVLALIPARGGSKSVPRKNVLPIGGKPLIAWTIEAAHASGVCDRVIVSTDDEVIAEIARCEGAEVPFLRPETLARDETPDYPVFENVIHWLQTHEGWEPEIVVWLRPTSPLRSAEDIRSALELLSSTGADAVRSVCAVAHHPYWMKCMETNGRLTPLISGHDEHSFPRRQSCPPVYMLSGLVDIVRVSSARKNGALFVGDVRGYVASMERSIELDSPEDIEPIAKALSCASDDGSRSGMVQIALLYAHDAQELSDLILGDTLEYREHFTPFPFDTDALRNRLLLARRDQYWGIWIGDALACCFMLRGFDAGYERPSFGVYVGERFAGSGLATLALQYALTWCRLQGIVSVMLKVHPENSSARSVYERAGFTFDRVCENTSHHVFVKVFRQQP
jgi:CMP-N,N'-diacetyllegionaminic acid synthase